MNPEEEAGVNDSSLSESSSSDEGWQDVEPDEEEIVIISLFDDRVFSNVHAMLDYCRNTFHFDFIATKNRLGLDFHGAVKLCNYIRSRVHEGKSLPDAISREDFDDDSYLRPVIEDDGLILSLDEILDNDDGKENQDSAVEGLDATQLIEKNRQLQAELDSVKDAFANFRVTVEETLDKRWEDDTRAPAAQGNTSGSTGHPGDDSEYWNSYAGIDIHETMIKDAVRTDAYRDFIYENKHLFKDKVVLDVGCGTGILSMFCAKAGAKKVFAVDNSAILVKARENIFENGFADTITCVSGKIEEVTLPEDKVDIIVSEWMGYCLLYEAMLPSVIWARDRYLKPDGLLVPSVTTMWLAPISDADFISEHIEFWDDVYGFKMKAMTAGIYDDVRMQARPSASLCGTPSMFKQLDLHHVKVEDLTFESPWHTKLNRQVTDVDGLLIWFDTFFTESSSQVGDFSYPAQEPRKIAERRQIAFTTGPFGKETHWQQGIALIKPKNKPGSLDSDTDVSGTISISPLPSDPRALSTEIKWRVKDKDMKAQTWVVR